jgi:heme-degrading monooxygenase HmoA
MTSYMVFETHLDPDHAESFPGIIRDKLRDVYEFDGFEGVVKCWRDAADPNHFLLIERWATREHHQAYLKWRADRGERMSGDVFTQPIRVEYYENVDHLFLPAKLAE